ncbi:hypothetical protein [Salinicola tamaricis]|uniref:hypothetical protein n=1 Tax=Salinicola tamaricis TaxID=1771309 RepID=UPI0013ED95C8|nr:hypothetical protein [Salinicola tamaricis]
MPALDQPVLGIQTLNSRSGCSLNTHQLRTFTSVRRGWPSLADVSTINPLRDTA